VRRLQVVTALALVGLTAAGLAVAGMNNNSSIHLSGEFEVPIRDTQAQGQAIFKIADDGDSIDFRLIASNIENVVAAHIHCGEPGVNGPVVVFLYGTAAPGAGRTDGVLSTGTLTDESVPTTDPCGITDIEGVVELLQTGTAYVNVHTNDGVAPTNTGPGDFPGGEIRGDA
jgi:hypothetical protein